MEIGITHREGEVPVTIIRVEGEFDAFTSDHVEKQAEIEIDKGAENLILDLSGVAFMSSAGVRVIYSLFNSLHPRESSQQEIARSKQMREGTYIAPHLKILNPNKQVHNVMKMVGIDRYIEIFEDEEAAVAAFHPLDESEGNT